MKTDPEAWPGTNVLGRMWLTVRQQIRASIAQEEVRSTDNGKRKERGSDAENMPSSRARPNGTTPDKDIKSKTMLKQVKSKIPSPAKGKEKNANGKHK